MPKEWVKTTAQQFKVFKKEFLRVQKKLSLGDWRAFLLCEKIGSDYGRIYVNRNYMTVTVILTDRVAKADLHLFEPGRVARHEAAHLLTAILYEKAKARYTTPEAVTVAVESIAHRLENIL